LVPAVLNLLQKQKVPKITRPLPIGNFDVKLAFIDAGMVTRLNEKDQANFFKLTWSVIKGDAKSCT
jgi:predicted unusual protein kinase regulating ubiquinone biosynthesis (AarF/ABC1/UbiB family)